MISYRLFWEYTTNAPTLAQFVLFVNKFLMYGTCALIMYLLGERSSPLHCGQNPLLSGRKACALRAEGVC
ncbi:MAG: hypothetical protein EWV55_20970, partial [Microcystis viridis Mv_BB_P_19951000_S69]